MDDRSVLSRRFVLADSWINSSSANNSNTTAGVAPFGVANLLVEGLHNFADGLARCPGKPVAVAGFRSDFGRFCSKLHREPSFEDHVTSRTQAARPHDKP